MQRHIDPREAEEVVRLAVAREAAPPAVGPTVEGLAEALSLPVSEVERLLAQVRRRTAPAAPQRRFADRSAALSAGIVLALVLTVAAVGGFYRYAHRPIGATARGPAPMLGGTVSEESPIANQGGSIYQTPIPPASQALVTTAAPLPPSMVPWFTEGELTRKAQVVREVTRNVARLSLAQRRARYEALMDSIEGQRSIAAEIRRRAPTRRTPGGKALLQAVSAFDRLFDVSDDE